MSTKVLLECEDFQSSVDCFQIHINISESSTTDYVVQYYKNTFYVYTLVDSVIDYSDNDRDYGCEGCDKNETYVKHMFKTRKSVMSYLKVELLTFRNECHFNDIGISFCGEDRWREGYCIYKSDYSLYEFEKSILSSIKAHINLLVDTLKTKKSTNVVVGLK